MTIVSATPSRGSLHRVSSIDALRGIAALSVVIYHARAMYWIGCSETYRQFGLHPGLSELVGYLSIPLSYGSLGVTLFFVLSGYCIHRRGARLLAIDATSSINYKSYFHRRFLRIYPTYFAALILTAAVDSYLFTYKGETNQGQDNSLYAFAISLLTLQGYAAPFYGSNGVFWTLAMEVHLYIMYPFLFFMSRKWRPLRTLLFTLVVSLSYLIVDGFVDINQYLPYHFQRGPIFLPYWFTWTVGFFIADLEAGRTKVIGKPLQVKIMSVGALLGIILLNYRLYELADIFWSLCFGGILMWSVEPQGCLFWSRCVGRWLAFVGVFSYSLYAVHVPILELFHSLVAPNPFYKFPTIWPSLIAAAASVPIGWLFFRLFEYWSIRKPPQ